jgi:hypothetical protein
VVPGKPPGIPRQINLVMMNSYSRTNPAILPATNFLYKEAYSLCPRLQLAFSRH